MDDKALVPTSKFEKEVAALQDEVQDLRYEMDTHYHDDGDRWDSDVEAFSQRMTRFMDDMERMVFDLRYDIRQIRKPSGNGRAR